MRRANLRAIPSVERILLALGDVDLPRPAVAAVVRRELAALRKQKAVPGFESILSRVRVAIGTLRASRIRPLLNGTGILIHTNFGRAPLGAAVIETVAAVGSQYSNIEYELTAGARGERAAYLEHNLSLLCSAEGSTIVNNNAAALVLILRHFCGRHFCRPPTDGDRKANRNHPPENDARRNELYLRNEVIISRGELIQIGGGFRVPEILESSGARVREVGTTNKTSLADYARAITRETVLILKVHHSNFFMSGFVESPPTEEIAAIAHKKHVPFVEDLGSGAVIKTSAMRGLEHEPTPAEVLRRGVDLVCFSGDKLLGGPQAGIIAGRARLINALKRDPFFRALRCDKLILSALQTTVDFYLSGGGNNSQPANTANAQGSREAAKFAAGLPVLEMLHASNGELRARAEKIAAALAGKPLKVSVGVGRAQFGGGALPRSVIPSITVDLTHDSFRPQELSARLRRHTLPVIGYIERGKLKIDLRTIFPRQDADLVEALRSIV